MVSIIEFYMVCGFSVIWLCLVIQAVRYHAESYITKQQYDDGLWKMKTFMIFTTFFGFFTVLMFMLFMYRLIFG